MLQRTVDADVRCSLICAPSLAHICHIIAKFCHWRSCFEFNCTFKSRLGNLSPPMADQAYRSLPLPETSRFVPLVLTQFARDTVNETRSSQLRQQSCLKVSP